MIEVISIGIAFLFLVLICGTVLTALSFIVYRNNALFNANLMSINQQLGTVYADFQNGIKANQTLAEDLNKRLTDANISFATSQNFDDRLKNIEYAIKMKSTNTRVANIN